MIISVVNTKGGVGKSTSSWYLACAAAAAGYDVHLIDTDQQATLTEWAQFAREDEALPFEFSNMSTSQLEALARRKSTKDKVVIIDTPPALASVIDTAIKIADLVVVPMQPSGSEVSRAMKTLNHIGHDKARALLCRCVSGTVLLNVAREALSELPSGVVIPVEIPNRQAVIQSFGTVPNELYGYDEALNYLLSGKE